MDFVSRSESPQPPLKRLAQSNPVAPLSKLPCIHKSEKKRRWSKSPQPLERGATGLLLAPLKKGGWGDSDLETKSINPHQC